MLNFLFCGLPVSSFTKKELSDYLNDVITNKGKAVCYGHSLGIFPRIMRQPETIEYIMNYDLYVSDGYKFHKLGKYLGYPFKYRISLPELTFFILDIANRKRLKIFLLGATPESNRLACKKINESYSNIKDCNGRDGYFSKKNEPEIIEEINKFNPDILFLGMPSPKKEKFIYENKDKINAQITVLNGGMIDVLSGKAKLTPPLLKKLGLALFYRFMQDPKSKMYQFLVYYPLINLYFIPLLIWHYKIKKNYQYSIKDMWLINRKL